MTLVIATVSSGGYPLDPIATLGIVIAIHLIHFKTWREPKAIQLLCFFGQITLRFLGDTSSYSLSLGIMIDIEGSLSNVMILAGDLVICWRAWVLLPHDKFWRFVLAIFLICNTGLFIADLIFDDFTTIGSQVTLTSVLDLVVPAMSFIGPLQNNERSISLEEKSGSKNSTFSRGIWGSFPTPPEEGAETNALVQNTALAVWEASAALYPIAIILIIQSDSAPIVERLNTHRHQHFSTIVIEHDPHVYTPIMPNYTHLGRLQLYLIIHSKHGTMYTRSETMISSSWVAVLTAEDVSVVFNAGPATALGMS
ncbi:hypothetical protein BDP27DRAFT_1369862 [Rhodocollybia butyracea]|uniref:Uncharacterized protein n=1 Tax=Rhodocollybia butyracea TaxID=206335 RepID=A0A9P5PFN1_9AGAR|nr:hypothetical protein BDP27DRAFT_1369862 [Rhodocollybia butyracea]